MRYYRATTIILRLTYFCLLDKSVLSSLRGHDHPMGRLCSPSHGKCSPLPASRAPHRDLTAAPPPRTSCHPCKPTPGPRVPALNEFTVATSRRRLVIPLLAETARLDTPPLGRAPTPPSLSALYTPRNLLVSSTPYCSALQFHEHLHRPLFVPPLHSHATIYPPRTFP